MEQQETGEESLLHGWEQIGHFLGISGRHAKRLYKLNPFPLKHRIGERGWVRMTTEEALKIKCPDLSRFLR